MPNRIKGRLKPISQKMKDQVEQEVIQHLSRGNEDAAFHVLLGLWEFGFGYLGSEEYDAVHAGVSEEPCHNIRWWFEQIKERFEHGNVNQVEHHCTVGSCATS